MCHPRGGRDWKEAEGESPWQEVLTKCCTPAGTAACHGKTTCPQWRRSRTLWSSSTSLLNVRRPRSGLQSKFSPAFQREALFSDGIESSPSASKSSKLLSHKDSGG